MKNVEVDSQDLLIPVLRDIGFNKVGFGLEDYRLVPIDHSIEQVALDDLRLSNTLVSSSPMRGRDAYPDIYVFGSLWAHRHELPDWLKQENPLGLNFTQFYFPGTRLVTSNDIDCLMYMRWGPNYWLPIGDSAPRWHWGVSPVDYDWGFKFPCLVLSL